MDDSKLNPEALGFNKRDEARHRIIEEVAEMRSLAVETGGERHLPAIDRIEGMALEATEQDHEEK
jgi:hypothetical protein